MDLFQESFNNLIKKGRNMINKKKLVLYISSIIFLSGCASIPKSNKVEKISEEPFSIIAKYSFNPVVIDGNLDDCVWQISPAYTLVFAKQYYLPMERRIDKRIGIDISSDKGIVKVGWDEQYLYIAVKFYDSDIVQYSNKNQEMHCNTGDLVEVFLKPENNTYYWEIYGTPNEKKTVFFYPGGGYLSLPVVFSYNTDLDAFLVSSKIKGTLNNWHDRDEYWTLEMAIPVKELTKYGDKFGSGSEWRILISRYNYSRYELWPALTSVPQLSIANFHQIPEYGKLIFQK